MSLDLRRLLSSAQGADPPRVLLVVAHPDDETVGAGVLLSRLADVHLLHVTDGAPIDRAWWGDPSLPSREAYAALRTQELRAAIRCVGLPPDRLHSLNIVDQQASSDLATLALRVLDVMRKVRPQIVLTHPYEGGHPDHDACAFAVHAARAVMDAGNLGEPVGREPDTSTSIPGVVEFTSYHAGADARVVAGEFLDGGSDVVGLRPSNSERALKRRMLACYASQSATLSGLTADLERFRPAPRYDFTQPPHPGPLYYERFAWGSTGGGWRELAGHALTALGLRQEPTVENAESR